MYAIFVRESRFSFYYNSCSLLSNLRQFNLLFIIHHIISAWLLEIEYIKELFSEYRPIHLNIWHTFTDTTLDKLVKMNEMDDEI